MKTKTLHSIVWQEGKLFVAKFLELELASQGKTKAEALRFALLHVGEELGVMKPRLHAKAELYAYKEIKRRLSVH